MKKRRICMMEFRPYEAAAFTQYLNEMADKGWILTGFRGGLLCFDRGEPAAKRYLVVTAPGVSAFDSEHAPGIRQFRKLYEDAGWKYACSRIYWQIFVRDAAGVAAEQGEDCRAEETTEERLEQLRQSKATCLSWGAWARVIMLLLYLYWECNLLFCHPGESLASNYNLLLGVILAGCGCMYPVWLITAACWHRKAERVLRQTGKLPEVNLRQIRYRNLFENASLAVAAPGLLIVLTRNTRGAGSVLTVLIFILMWFLIFTINNGILNWVRENGSDDRRENAIGYGVGSVCIGVIIIMLGSGAMIKLTPDSYREATYERQGEFPAEFLELGFEADDEWRHSSSRSVLGFYQREAGERAAENGQSEHLVLEYYENRIPAVITKTRQDYDASIHRGNIWNVSGEELLRDGKFLVTHYHYELKEEEFPYMAKETGTKRDTYLISDRNRFFVIAYEDGVEEAEGRAAVELALGRMRKQS